MILLKKGFDVESLALRPSFGSLAFEPVNKARHEVLYVRYILGLHGCLHKRTIEYD